jgi:hypothetical protein
MVIFLVKMWVMLCNPKHLIFDINIRGLKTDEMTQVQTSYAFFVLYSYFNGPKIIMT